MCYELLLALVHFYTPENSVFDNSCQVFFYGIGHFLESLTLPLEVMSSHSFLLLIAGFKLFQVKSFGGPLRTFSFFIIWANGKSG